MMEEEVDPLDVLREDLEDDDVTVQLDAVRNLPTIALALGPELSRTKLLQFLEVFCFPTDTRNNIGKRDISIGVKEEVLREIALVLNGSMVPLLGGKNYALPILLLLQKLARVEETVIREAAVDGIISCVSELSGAFIDRQVFPLIAFLADEDFWTSRVSAAATAPRMYPYLSSKECRDQCEAMVHKLCRDEMPMVRKETYISIPYMLKTMSDKDSKNLVDFITPVLSILAKELQEHMRHQIVDMVKALLKLENEDLLEVCRAYISHAIFDTNWRVRKRFLEQLMDITQYAPEEFVNELLEGFVRRLRDNEPSVRVAAIKLIPDFFSLKNCNAKKVRELITEEVISELVKDEYVEAREAISGSILHLYEKLEDPDEGLSLSTKKEIVDIMMQFQSDDSGEVRLNFCKGLKLAYELCGEDLFVSSMLPNVLKLQEDSKWRVRSALLQNMSLFVGLCKSNKIPEHTFHDMLMEALKDPVADARNQCISKISGIVEVMGSKWVENKVFNVVVKELYEQQSKYLYRIVPIRIAQQLAVDLTGENLPEAIELRLKAVEMMCRGCKDHISNVRLASADALVNFLKADTSGQFDKIIGTHMELLSRDSDDDVRYLSSVTIGLLKV